MPWHHWGDEWFQKNGDDLNRAIHLCCEGWVRWGRIGTHGKEKYGTFRDQLWPYRGEWPIHELIKPGHVYYRWPKWVMRIELKLGKVIRKTCIPKIILWWQGHVYNYYVQKACRLFPNVVDELVADLDGYKWVRPGLFGPICGETVHKKYWKTLGEEDV